MRRPLAADAEVADRAYQAFAEVMLPDPIDHHAGEQGPGPLIHVGDPVRHRPSLAGAATRPDLPARGIPVILGRSRAGEHREEAALHPLLLRREVPAMEGPGRLGRGLPIDDREGRRRLLRLRPPGRLERFLEGVPTPALLVGEDATIVI